MNSTAKLVFISMNGTDSLVENEAFSVAIMYFLAVASILNCLLTFLLSLVHLQCHHSFHPLFSSLFLTALLTYFFDSLCLVICGFMDVMELSDAFQDVYYVFSLLERICYYYVSPILLLLLVERTFATAHVATYENESGWKENFMFAQIVTIFCVTILCFFEIEMNSIVENLWSYLLLSIYLLMYSALFFLFKVNRRNILSLQTERVTLTLRYQLAENIKTIRMLSIFLFFDTAITVVDVASYIGYGIGEQVEKARTDDLVYVISFTVTVVAICILSNVFPVLLLFTTNAYFVKFMRFTHWAYRDSGTIFDGAKVKVHQTAPVHSKQSTKLRNVLGAEIVMQQDTDRYFENLRQMWQ